MLFRRADAGDIEQLRAIFLKIVEQMNEANGPIWDEHYPCDAFVEDIEKQRLFLLLEGDTIACAFALLDNDPKAPSVRWRSDGAGALYLSRLGVNVDYQRRGVGMAALEHACVCANEAGAQYLRLFVVDKNKSALDFYTAAGFSRASGQSVETLDDGSALRQFGFEKETGKC